MCFRERDRERERERKRERERERACPIVMRKRAGNELVLV